MSTNNYLVTGYIGNPVDPSRIDVIGVYRSMLTAKHFAVNALFNGYYAPSTIKTKHSKTVKIINKNFIPLTVSIENSKSTPYMSEYLENKALIMYNNKLKSSKIYLNNKDVIVKCKSCKKKINNLNITLEPDSMLCSKCKNKIIINTIEKEESKNND
jgi:hypothetical protein